MPCVARAGPRRGRQPPPLAATRLQLSSSRLAPAAQRAQPLRRSSATSTAPPTACRTRPPASPARSPPPRSSSSLARAPALSDNTTTRRHGLEPARPDPEGQRPQEGRHCRQVKACRRRSVPRLLAPLPQAAPIPRPAQKPNTDSLSLLQVLYSTRAAVRLVEVLPPFLALLPSPAAVGRRRPTTPTGRPSSPASLQASACLPSRRRAHPSRALSEEVRSLVLSHLVL